MSEAKTTTENTTTAPLAPAILAEDGHRRLVQLHCEHELRYGCAYSLIVTASFTESGATIERLSSEDNDDDDEEKKDKRFYLDNKALDTLTNVWTQYKADIAAKKAAEEAEKAAMVADAYALAKEWPIEIEQCKEEDGTVYRWNVKIPAIGWRDGNYNPSQLWESVQDAVKVCQDRDLAKVAATDEEEK